MGEDIVSMEDQEPITWADVKNAQQPSTRLYFDLDGQTVDALDQALEHLRRVPDHPMSWKWVVICMHAALQGSFGLALERTDGAQLLVRWQEEQFWERVERERTTYTPEEIIYARFARYKWRPVVRRTGTGRHSVYVCKVRSKGSNPLRESEPKVDRFLGLFAKTRKAHRMGHFGGIPLKPTPEQTRSVKYLNSTRNFLIHFSDTAFVTDAASQLTDITNGLDIIEILLTRTQGIASGGPIDTITDYELAARARQLIGALRSEVRATWERYSLTPPN